MGLEGGEFARHRHIECLRSEGRALTARETIDRSGLSRSTAFRYLQAMLDEGYLLRDNRNKKYILGSRILALGTLARRQLAADDIIGPPLSELHRRTRETVTFSLLDNTQRVCVFVLEAKSDLRQVANVGDRYPLHLGAAGKVLLAQHDPGRVLAILRASGMTKKAELERVTEQLEHIRSVGYAVTSDERVPGTTAVAGVVLVDRAPWASVAVAGPTSRMRELVKHSSQGHAHLPNAERVALHRGGSRTRQEAASRFRRMPGVYSMKLVDLTQPLSPKTPRSLDYPEVQFPVVRWFSRHGVNT